jgi:hypothetical protein
VHAICGMSLRVSLGKPRATGLLHGCDCPALWRDVTDLGVTHLPCGQGVGDPETDDPEIDFRVSAGASEGQQVGGSSR